MAASIADPSAVLFDDEFTLADGDEMSDWALKQYVDKYSWKDASGEPSEVWPDTAYRVVRHVLGALGYTDQDPEFKSLVNLIAQRKFMPGGRYLASAGRPIHQTNNCFLYRAEDSREGWADVVRKSIMSLSSGGGIGVVWSDIRPNGAPIKKTGGVATGPLSPANMVNEVARHVMQGGHRRSAIWGGLHWCHPDIFDWIVAKDWSDEILAAKAKDFNTPAPLDMTNISVILDDAFFLAYQDELNPNHELAQRVYWEATTHMLKHGEPGFSIDTGVNAGENLRNAPVAGDTHVMTLDGYRPVRDIVGREVTVWTGKQWADDVVFEKTRENAPILAVEMTGGRVIRCEPSHEFLVERYVGAGQKRTCSAIERIAAKDLVVGDQLHVSYINPVRGSQRVRIRPDLEDYKPYRPAAIKVLSVIEDGYENVYCADVHQPEHSFMAEGVIISNCTEITSADDNDVCNLGSLNMARFETIEEFDEAAWLATLFLMAGTVYSDVPHEEVRKTRSKNRRLGLGLMGMHEWLLKRGYDYQVTPELHEWLAGYRDTSDSSAKYYAELHNLSLPVKVRAIAPNGTISIVAQTTSGIEPMFCVAFKRRFIDTDRQWKYQYVVDPTAQRLKEQHGLDPDGFESAYSLAYNPEKRIKFQADVQRYVDHGISSTLNLPYPVTDTDEVTQFGEVLMEYLPYLRGITAYPDGARSGQPLTVVTYDETVGQEGVTFEEDPSNGCKSGVCGI